MLVYYHADVASIAARDAPADAEIRPLRRDDVPALADLYLRAYDPPRADSIEAAVREMEATFDGEWGEPWPAATLGAYVGGELAAVVQTVRRPSWEDALHLPWVIELFTAPAFRRRGLGRRLLVAACAAVDEPRIGLTVDTDNRPALALYTDLGFDPLEDA